MRPLLSDTGNTLALNKLIQNCTNVTVQNDEMPQHY